MSSAVTPEMLTAGAMELLGSGMLQPGVDFDKDAQRLMVCVGRIWMRMQRVAPANMTREGEWFDPQTVGKRTILLPGGK